MSSFAGTAALTRLALRRDRVVLVVFVLVLVVMVAGLVAFVARRWPRG